MTSFTRTWNAAYEAQPADNENISLGASRIRDLKADIQERGEVDHHWAGDTDDGAHKKITLKTPLGADPANAANTGFIYIKDVSSKVELFWEDEDGNVLQLTSGGAIQQFPSGTRMLFHQTAAPTGWTKDTTANLNNTALRVITGTVGSRTDQSSFTTVFGKTATDGHLLTAAQSGLPSHTHTVPMRGSDLSRSDGSGSVRKSGGSVSSGSAGGTSASQTHSHNMDIRVNYHDVIIASKD